jgi:chorismate mutase/prephenate dehydrogenase
LAQEEQHPATGTPGGLAAIRERLSALDRQLLEIAAERQRLSGEVARIKRATGYPTRDYARERDVLLRAADQGAGLGLPPGLADGLMRLLIRASLTTQEQAQWAAQSTGTGKRALVIGGHGKLGAWFAEFLASQGYAVTVADPSHAPRHTAHAHQFARVDHWEDACATGAGPDHDLIVVATPLSITAEVLQALALRPPTGLVFDLGSLKTPLRAGLQALVAAGCRVTSLHPMFGPDTELLSGRHLVFIDLGHAEALAEARALFAVTMVEQRVMSLDDHDRVMAFVLGLSHAVNIAFFTALARSGETAPRLAELSSTTFDSQLEVAKRVAAEDPALYYEIQAANAYGAQSLAALAEAVEALRASVATADLASFTALMDDGRAYLESRLAAPGVPRP